MSITRTTEGTKTVRVLLDCDHPGCWRCVFFDRFVSNQEIRGDAQQSSGWTYVDLHDWCGNHAPNPEKIL